MLHIWNKKRNNLKRVLIAGLLAVCLVVVMKGQTVYAAGEKVYYGSESYEWWLDEDHFLLGVYASSDDGLDAVDLTVSYDSTMIEIVQGAESIETGKVRVQAENLSGDEFKRLLSFRPLMAGTTQITIESAQITNAHGETVEAVAQTAAVSIEIPDNLALEGITVNGNPIQNFNGKTAAYTVDLAEFAETADISVAPSSTNVEISDTALQTGKNTVTVTVTGANGDKARYALTLNNPEAPVPASTETETESEVIEPETQVAEQTEESEEAEEMDDSSQGVLGQGKALVERSLSYASEMLENHRTKSVVMLVTAAVLVIIFFLLLFAHVRHKKKERARKLRRQERRRQWEETLREDTPETNIEESFVDEADMELDPKEFRHEGIEGISVEDSGKAIVEADDIRKEEAPRELEIRVSHVTMDFKREKDESTSVKELVIRTLKHQRSFVYFRALDDISFDVYSGEVVGIIGTNGSGKSTILKIVSGVLAPTSGKVEVDQHKIQLLTLGTGFDMELTGRENVYLNGALIGYTKEYIDEKYDDIVKFAELEGFMDEKVRNYSSGMVSRLGFAIATIRDTPEILILDEVLSVGDMFFRRKSEARIQEMIHGGSTILIVSHSTGVIRKNCTKVVWIEKSHLKMIGDPDTVCAAYEKMNG